MIKNVTIIDCKNVTPLVNQSLILQDSIIYDIGKFEELDIPDGADIIDGSGKFILPGLIDHHAHVTILGNRNSKRVFDRKASEQVLKMLLDHGITAIRNPAAPIVDGIQLRNDVRSGKIEGPEIFTSGEAIQYCNGRVVDLWEHCVSDNAEAVEEVNRQIANDVDFIKVYSSVPEIITKTIVETAHRSHIKVSAHTGATSWTQAAALGVDIFEHGSDWNASLLPPDKRQEYEYLIRSKGPMKARIKWLEWIDPESVSVAAMIQQMKEGKVIVCPTLIAYATKFMGNDSLYIANPELQRIPGLVSGWKKGTFVDDWSAEDFREGHKHWPKMLSLLKKYYDEKVPLVVGSDLPNPWVIPGVSLYQEMELYSQAGIPNYDILKMCTVNGAFALGILNKAGTIEKGKIADLIILNVNPLEDIRNISSVFAVFNNGRKVKRFSGHFYID